MANTEIKPAVQQPAVHQPQPNNEQMAADARKADEAHRASASKAAAEGTKKARASSAETLKEQENMKPVPSQEDADKMVSGAYDALKAEEVEQPDGPRARALQSLPGTGGSYVNRADKSS